MAGMEKNDPEFQAMMEAVKGAMTCEHGILNDPASVDPARAGEYGSRAVDAMARLSPSALYTSADHMETLLRFALDRAPGHPEAPRWQLALATALRSRQDPPDWAREYPPDWA